MTILPPAAPGSEDGSTPLESNPLYFRALLVVAKYDLVR
jgi:hypothetical protein